MYVKKNDCISKGNKRVPRVALEYNLEIFVKYNRIFFWY